MEIGTWLEKLPYAENDPKGGSLKEKSVWVSLFGGKKLGMCPFSIPYSGMIPFPDGDLYKIVMVKGERFIKYKMTKGWHNSCTWGKKKTDGTRMFKSSKTYGAGVSTTGTTGGSGLTRTPKTYYCNTCKSQKYLERDDKGNAYCVDCGSKVFSG